MSIVRPTAKRRCYLTLAKLRKVNKPKVVKQVTKITALGKNQLNVKVCDNETLKIRNKSKSKSR